MPVAGATADPTTPGLDHLGLGCESREQLTAWAEHLGGLIDELAAGSGGGCSPPGSPPAGRPVERVDLTSTDDALTGPVRRRRRGRIGYRTRRTRTGRSRSAHARSAVRTSAGSLRTVSARQHRSPSDRLVPPSSERIAPANSASSWRTGSMPTPLAASNPPTRLTSTPASTNFPITSARLPSQLLPSRVRKPPSRRRARRASAQGSPTRRERSLGDRSREAALGK